MSTEKRIVCLANSDMTGGKCVAGKELIKGEPAGWIRLVGENGGVPWKQFAPLELLRIITVSVDRLAPEEHQKENWLLDTTGRPPWWEGENRPWNTPAQLVDYPVEPLWTSGYSTHGRKNNEVPSSQIDRIENSLRFIRVAELTLAPYEDKVIGHFYHDNIEYKLPVTDPNYKVPSSKEFNEGGNKMGECYLTVSLAGRIHEKSPYCYKIIAAIIPHDKSSGT